LDSESRLTQLIHGGKVPPQPEEEVDIMMSQTALAYLGKAGYRHYASCASCGYDLAQPGKECVYEYRHWAAPQIEYLGLGAGAFSFIRGHIYCNLSTVEAYSALVRKGHFPVVAGKKLTLADKMSRYMVLGAKCLAVETSPFEERFGLPLRQVFQEPLQRLSAWGLVEDDGSTIRVTERGKLYGDNISKAFYDKAYYLMPHPLEPDIQKLSEQQPVAASQDLVSV
jgi:oxygen-independent coproporphyrinogen-3 oxidase